MTGVAGPVSTLGGSLSAGRSNTLTVFAVTDDFIGGPHSTPHNWNKIHGAHPHKHTHSVQSSRRRRRRKAIHRDTRWAFSVLSLKRLLLSYSLYVCINNNDETEFVECTPTINNTRPRYGTCHNSYSSSYSSATPCPESRNRAGAFQLLLLLLSTPRRDLSERTFRHSLN